MSNKSQEIMGKNQQSSFIKALIKQAIHSGTIAALAMVPFALLFSSLGLRINEYGKKTVQLFFGSLSPKIRVVLFAAEHFMLSWIFAIPLLLLMSYFHQRFHPVLLGFLYGLLFYILINSLLLPLLWNDPIPWKMNFIRTVFPSLTVHIVYGVTVAMTSGKFIKKHSGLY